MSLQPKAITQLQTLIQSDPALRAQVEACADPAGAAGAIVKAAADHGIVVSAADVVAELEASAAKVGSLSDADLEQVAGGSSGPINPKKDPMMDLMDQLYNQISRPDPQLAPSPKSKH